MNGLYENQNGTLKEDGNNDPILVVENEIHKST